MLPYLPASMRIIHDLTRLRKPIDALRDCVTRLPSDYVFPFPTLKVVGAAVSIRGGFGSASRRNPVILRNSITVRDPPEQPSHRNEDNRCTQRKHQKRRFSQPLVCRSLDMDRDR